MRRLLCRGAFASLAAVLLAGGPARAELVTAELQGTNLNTIINPGADVTINLGDGSAPTTAYHPGVVNWTGNKTSPSLGYNFTTFCIELTQDISPGNWYTYTLTNLENAPKPGTSQTGGSKGMLDPKADKVRELWGAYRNAIGSDGNLAAAFQLDIWKIEYDYGTSYDFSSGNFRATAADPNIIKQATTWLTTVRDNNLLPRANLVALTSPGAQDQVAEVVPAPPAVYLLGSGILCLGGFWFLRRKPGLVAA